MSTDVSFGPTGKVVFDRTYSRTRPDGSKETWHQMAERVAYGNIALVHGKAPGLWSKEVCAEAWALKDMIERMAILPAGRHLWATGVDARQYLFNCHVSGWGEKLSDHFEFTSMRLFEGGGVGANYSTKHIEKYGAPKRKMDVKVFAERWHKDYAELEPFVAKSGLLDNGYIYRVEDSREGWARALSFMIDQAMADTWTYDQIVFDVTDVRPSGSKLVTSGGSASGPAPLARELLDSVEILNRAYEHGHFTPLDLMEIDHAIAEAVVSGGTRRSARMAIVHWDDPYIADFLACKEDTGKHWTTNISVEIDDEFLAELDDPYSDASVTHALVVAGMLKNGEPGYWNSSLSQVGEIGEVIATNPCGEIALQSWENCNLGHVNLDAFAPKPDGNGGMTRFDYEGMKEAHRLVTRFLMRATYGDVNDDKQRDMLHRNRRIGVGHLGVQGFWAKLGVQYSAIPNAGSANMLDTLYKIVRQEARDYAFQLRIPEPVKVTAVAPTGSVAKLPGVTEGIHPIYARWFERRVRFSLRDEAQFNMVQEYAASGFTVETDVYDKSGMTAVVVFPTEDLLLAQVRELGWWEPESLVQSADEISVEAMLQVQRHYQEHWADNAVSYTVNIPEQAVSADELADTLARFLPYLKGTTVMVDSSRPQAPYTRITQEQYAVAAAKTVEDGTDAECSSGACPIR
jgi:ribonucleoside-triphosphate reductase (thioredoxin)